MIRNMRHYHIVYILGTAALWGTLTLMSSCTKHFEEINRPAERIDGEEIRRDGFMTASFFKNVINTAIPSQENYFQHCENIFGHVYAHYGMFTDQGWASAKNPASYILPDSWYDAPTNNDFIKDWREIADLSGLEGVDGALALILRGIYTQRIADMYGPTPYSKVLESKENVPYDSQEDIYKGIIADLTKASDMLAGVGVSSSFAENDLVYAGDYAKWRKLANSIKLRMALRMSKADPEYAKKAAREAYEAGVILTNQDNALISYNPNPLYIVSYSYFDYAISAELETYLKGFNDPRMEKMVSNSHIDGYESTIVGMRFGAVPRVGVKSSEGLYSRPNVTASTKNPWLLAPEMMFCLAEGKLNGWDFLPESVQTYYERAVTLSFEYWGVASEADRYLSDDHSTQSDYVDPVGSAPGISAVSSITIKWDDSDSEEIKREKIATQKWLALYPLGVEAWSELRRTGYPKVFPSPNAQAEPLPVPARIPFPKKEYKNNHNNYEEAVKLLGGPDKFGTKLWWNK